MLHGLQGWRRSKARIDPNKKANTLVKKINDQNNLAREASALAPAKVSCPLRSLTDRSRRSPPRVLDSRWCRSLSTPSYRGAVPSWAVCSG